MATTGVNAVEEKQKGRGALENFASAMGILSTLGNLGMQAYGAFNPQISELDKLLELQRGGKMMDPTAAMGGQFNPLK